MTTDAAARWVLNQYPVAGACRDIVPLGNRGGFSGARVWRVETAAGPLCLREWPVDVSFESLNEIHRLMALARTHGLPFVPAVLPTGAGTTCILRDRRLWDLTTWMPGQADFGDNPTLLRLRAACTALARLHQAWAACAGPPRPCPALFRRLDRLHDWQQLVRSGWRPDYTKQPALLAAPAHRALTLVERHLPTVSQLVNRWSGSVVPVQPCLCDIWHDHVLFEGDTVSGLIDYGSIKIDHVAVDLARLLGSFVGDDPDGWRVGLEVYRSVRPLSAKEVELAQALDQTGTVLALANWLTWLYRERRSFDNAAAVAQRLEMVVLRVERWKVL